MFLLFYIFLILLLVYIFSREFDGYELYKLGYTYKYDDYISDMRVLLREAILLALLFFDISFLFEQHSRTDIFLFVICVMLTSVLLGITLARVMMFKYKRK